MANEENLKPFKKGNDPRRNLGGRPKGTKNLSTVLKELLATQDKEGVWSKPIAMQLFRKAFRDNELKALVEIMDRIEGKVAQRTEHSGAISGEGLQVTLNVVDLPIKKAKEEQPNKEPKEPNVVDLKNPEQKDES